MQNMLIAGAFAFLMLSLSGCAGPQVVTNERVVYIHPSPSYLLPTAAPKIPDLLGDYPEQFAPAALGALDSCNADKQAIREEIEAWKSTDRSPQTRRPAPQPPTLQ